MEAPNVSYDEPPESKVYECEDPEEYIGLSDKNGKEIYEGDIVRDPIDFMGKYLMGRVQYYKDSFCINYHKQKPCGCNERVPSRTNYKTWRACEIIGNKFENPELLET